jgi:hypothetical protein
MFIVRVWHEASAVVPAGQWRGSVEHPATGQRLYFTKLNDMVGFISDRMTLPPSNRSVSENDDSSPRS